MEYTPDDDVRQRCERAFAAYLATYQADDNAFAGVQIIYGQQLGEMKLPRIVCAAPTCTAGEMGMGYMIVDLTVEVSTQIDEDVAVERHRQRFGLVGAILDDDETVLAALNPPDSGPDTRAITGFRIYGYNRESESSTRSERHWTDTHVLSVHCQAADGNEGME